MKLEMANWLAVGMCLSCSANVLAPSDGGGLPAISDGSAPSDAGAASDAGAPPDAGSPPDSGVTDGGSFPAGWYEIPNTTLQAVAPDPTTYADIQAVEGASCVIGCWGGGFADTARDRLVVWGGGHDGYFGNEVYALDLGARTLLRLTDPSTGSALADLNACPETYSDGRPAARHTYNGPQYLPGEDLYFMAGAGLPPCGNFSDGVWTFDPKVLSWTSQDPSGGPNPEENGSVPQEATDPNTGLIYEVEANTGVFWSYDLSGNAWSNLGNVTACSALDATTAIDPLRHLYFCIGNGGFNKITIPPGGPYVATDLSSAAGCSVLVNASAPGFAYDSARNAMVGWQGGNAVYVYDADTNSCTAQSYAGGPPAQSQSGTYGRWRYFPNLDVFALVNDWSQNAYTLRLTP
jgi:hypothetical protein